MKLVNLPDFLLIENAPLYNPYSPAISEAFISLFELSPVMKLTAPEKAFVPNTREAGPFRISMRSML
jgi:hypothetical protein